MSISYGGPIFAFGSLKEFVGKYLEERIRAISERKGSEIEALKVMKDHAHPLMSAPPKVSIYVRADRFYEGSRTVKELSQPPAQARIGKSSLAAGIVY